MKKPAAIFLIVIFVFTLILSIFYGIEIVFFAIKAPEFTGCERIYYCYDYSNANNYELMTPKEHTEYFLSDSVHNNCFIEEERFYIDDFGKIYKVSHTQSLFFKTNITKTEIESKYKDGSVITVVQGQVFCPCRTLECPHKSLQTIYPALYFDGSKNFSRGYRQIDYCYDFINEKDYEIVESSRSQKLYVDDFGKVYVEDRSKQGLFDTDIEMIELKSKHEGGSIVIIDSGRVFCPCDTDECPHQKLKSAIENEI